MKRSIIGLVAALLLLAPVGAQSDSQTSAKGAYLFINDLGRWTIAVMQSEAISAADRDVLFSRLLVERMDFEALAKFSLGPYANQANGEEFKEFTNLFAAHIIDDAIDKFASAPIRGFAATKLLRQGDGDVVVVTKIVRDAADPFFAGWRVRDLDGAYKIVDVLLDGGNSMGLHFRNQYEARLERDGVGGLIDRLERMTKGSPTVALVQQARGN